MELPLTHILSPKKEILFNSNPSIGINLSNFSCNFSLFQIQSVLVWILKTFLHCDNGHCLLTIFSQLKPIGREEPRRQIHAGIKRCWSSWKEVILSTEPWLLGCWKCENGSGCCLGWFCCCCCPGSLLLTCRAPQKSAVLQSCDQVIDPPHPHTNYCPQHWQPDDDSTTTTIMAVRPVTMRWHLFEYPLLMSDAKNFFNQIILFLQQGFPKCCIGK